MQLVLLTNMPSLHQVQLGRQLAKRLGPSNFRLVFHKPTSDAREEMGWADEFANSYILRPWQSKAEASEVTNWINHADVVVQGRYPMQAVKARITRGQLTFAYQERFWKRPFNWGRVVARLPRIYKRYWSVMKPNYHLLAAGAYVASDLAKLGCFKNRAWKFGYFMDAPEGIPEKQKRDQDRYQEHSRLELLWCARFSAVKRAEDALVLVRALLARDVDCHLTMIGDGELRAKIEASAADVGQAITFCGWQSSDVVMQTMQSADVFLMTSGFGEGWAMVINEAQNAACMVVANENVGAAPWLVEDGVSGLLYDQCDMEKVVDRMRDLTKDQINAMGVAGFISHQKQWSARSAAERLVALSTQLLSDSAHEASMLFADGPCSPAK